jgi:diguanylate cyclase
MNEAFTAPAEPKDIGHAAIRALANMNIPPKPAYYEVWFSHLERTNDALSSEILQKISTDNTVDEYFLKSVHERYFEIAHPAKLVEQLAVETLNETTSLKSLSDTFSANTKEFGDNIIHASDQATEEETELESASRLITALVDATQKAASKNQELQEELLVATTKVTNLQSSIEAITKDATTDFLTKLNNRRYFDSAIEQLVTLAHQEKAPLSFIAADIDHFKLFNDKWGHQVGDQVLKLVAEVLRENIKGQDLLARYGGEEFVIALPNTSLSDAETLAEHIRIAIFKRNLINRKSNENLGRVTMSFGIALLQPNETADELFKAADTALYQAKCGGRNKVVSQTPVQIFE